MKQPKLSVKSDVILKKYESSLSIPEGKNCSKTIVALIGDSYKARNGRDEFVPVTLVQNRKDIGQASNRSAADKFFRGWNGYETLLRHTENVSKEIFKNMKFSEGMVIDGANIAVDYALEPFYLEQEPVINPTTDRTVTSGGLPIYRNTRVEFGPVTHTGLEIARDKTELSEVSESQSLEDEDVYSEDSEKLF